METAVKQPDDRQFKQVMALGGMATVLMLAGIIFDMVAGTMLSTLFPEMPKTAAERFAQLQRYPLLGLYNLDLLNLITTLIMIPAYFAVMEAHKGVNNLYAKLAFSVYLLSAAMFAAFNVSLPMLGLSVKYYAAQDEAGRAMLAAAGEALLARGAHGTMGVFLGFFMCSLSSVLLSIGMIAGGVFGKTTGWIGLASGVLLLAYSVIVAFIPGAMKASIALAMPGGLLSMAWMVMFAVKFFKLAK